MRTITNDYKDAQILNLASQGERGPYLITQTGIAPSDPLLKTRMFVLRPDGYWVDFNAYASQGKPEAMDEIVFPSMTKIMETVDPVGKLQLIQRRIDLEAELERLSGASIDIESLEQAFVEVAASYSQAKGISYAAWREIGVDPAVLKKAGIGRAS